MALRNSGDCCERTQITQGEQEMSQTLCLCVLSSPELELYASIFLCYYLIEYFSPLMFLSSRNNVSILDCL